ncbi:MAG: hypothetical protein QM664_10850 [Flavihumibacter sp.]
MAFAFAEDMNTIRFHDSHVYPGCIATIPNSQVRGSVNASFDDGSGSMAEAEPLGPGELLVHIDAYTTARRTRIPAKSWRMKYDNTLDCWKVEEKIK